MEWLTELRVQSDIYEVGGKDQEISEHVEDDDGE